MANNQFGWESLGIRFIVAALLVFATYNPSGYSYYAWLRNTLPSITPLVAFSGIVLIILWAIFLRATMRSLGPLGLILAIAFFGTLIWMLMDWNLVSVHSAQAIAYIVLFGLAVVLAIGVSWSHIRRRISGQLDVDDVEEN
jgi:hypothetical protein